MNKDLRLVFKSLSLTVLALVLSVGVLYAATTIGGNITTDGTLLINNATSTITNLVMVNSTTTNATSTGYVAITGTLLVNNATSTITNLVMVNATSTNATTTSLSVATASSTGLVRAYQLKLNAAADSTLSGMAFGYCNIPAKTIVGTSTVYAVCDTATGVLANDRVFVQATSSLNGGGATLAGGAFIVAASSTAANTISVLLGSTGDADGGNTVTTPVSINFWAVR